MGRPLELGELLRAANCAVHGAGSVILLAGEPGIGKTRLAEELAARHDGTSTCASCWDGDGAPAFWPWMQVLRGCADDAALAAAGPAKSDVRAMLDAADGAADASRFRLFDGVTRVLDAVARRSPLLVVVDDLQWADEASVRLLRFVAHETPAMPLLIVGTYRDTDIGADHPLVAGLDDLARVGTQLTLGGLGRAEIAELARTVAGVDDGRFGDLLHRQTGGNPFFVRELVRLLRAEGRLRTGRLPLALASAGGVEAVVSRRLAHLPHPTQDVLAWAAVVGAGFDVSVLAASTGAPVSSVLADLDPAIAARLVVEEDAGGFTFVHDLVRETLTGSLGAADRAARHRAVGRALAATAGDDPARVAAVAGHLVAGVAGGDTDAAVAWAVRAAERAAAVLAYEEAAGWYERAITTRRLTVTGDDGEVRLLLALGAARLDAGDLPGARDTYRTAAALARARGDPTKLAEAALGLGAGFSGFEVSLLDQTQIDLLEEALVVLSADDSPLRALVLARLSVALSFVESEERRRALGDEAVAMARRLGDRVVLAYALAAWCDAVAGPDMVHDRLAAAEEVVRLARDAGRRTLELLGRRLRVVAQLELGHTADADAEIDAFDRRAQALRQPLYRWYVPVWRATRLMMRGRFEDAAVHTADAERIGGLARSENARTLVAVQRWVLLRYQDQFEEAARELRRATGDPPQPGNPTAAAVPSLVRDLVTGQADTAGDDAALLATAGGLDALRLDSEWLPNLAQLGEAAITLGDADLATAIHDRLLPYAALFCVEGIGAGVYGAAAHYLAALARFLGRDREAARHAALAAELHRRSGVAVHPPPLVSGATPDAPRTPPIRAGPAAAGLRLEGEVWSLTYGGRTVRLRDSKGLRDLAVLLRTPGNAVHCTELAGGVVATTAAVLDSRAVAAYRQRLVDLEGDLAEAEAHNDTGHAGRVRAERDFLVAELAGAVGLGGRERRAGDPMERARKAVTARVRDSIARISHVHPELGRHLSNSVRTGAFCSYLPERPVTWAISP